MVNAGRNFNVDYGGSLYEMDHLATFSVGQSDGPLFPEDGIKKLRQMEEKTGVWTMRCQMVVDKKSIIIIDRQTGEEIERFSLALVSDPAAVMNSDRRDVYNNVLLFTVSDDPKLAHYRGSHTSSGGGEAGGGEMHLFQCVSRPAQQLVDHIRQAKQGRTVIQANLRAASSAPFNSDFSGSASLGRHRYSPFEMPPPHEQPPQHAASSRFGLTVDRLTQQSLINQQQQQSRAVAAAAAGEQPVSGHTAAGAGVEFLVYVLNSCFDDIERFVSRLQLAANAFKELDRRRRSRKGGTGSDGSLRHKQEHQQQQTTKRRPGEGMLSMRAKPPPPHDFVDILQKIKLSFNLLAHLKADIEQPDSGQLVQFLFTPLALIVEASLSPLTGRPELAQRVVAPLLSRPGKQLLLSCLTSRETDLWRTLGEAWTTSVDEWRGEIPFYQPEFYSGFVPSVLLLDEVLANPSSVSGAVLTSPTSTSASHHSAGSGGGGRGVGGDLLGTGHSDLLDDERGRGFLTESLSRPTTASKQARPPTLGAVPSSSHSQHEHQHSAAANSASAAPVTTTSPAGSLGAANGYYSNLAAQQQQQQLENQQQREQQQPQLSYQGRGSSNSGAPGAASVSSLYDRLLREAQGDASRIYVVKTGRERANPKELTVRAGDLLLVLDNSKNWWRCRNPELGAEGFVPYTLLQPHRVEERQLAHLEGVVSSSASTSTNINNNRGLPVAAAAAAQPSGRYSAALAAPHAAAADLLSLGSSSSSVVLF